MKKLTDEINIALIDDQVIFRKGLINVIEGLGNFRIIMDVTHSIAFMQATDSCQIFPDICVLVLNMPVINGFDVLVDIRKRSPQSKILVLTSCLADYTCLRILNSAVNGIISKSCNPNELRDALETIHDVGFYYSPSLPEEILYRFRNKRFYIPKITLQERRFLSLCCTELTYAEIAAEMDVGLRTVDGYRTNLFYKLAVGSRAGLIMFVVQTGIVSYGQNLRNVPSMQTP